MTETRTPRFALPRYSQGSDSPSREDWDELVDHIEARAALDTGDTVVTLPPAAERHPGRYVLREADTGSDASEKGKGRTLYRIDENRNPYPVGGDVFPRTQTMRALESQPLTNLAWRVSHPDRPVDTARADWAGNVEYGGRVAVIDRNGTETGAVLHVGADYAPAPGVYGRAYVRTVKDGDRALVLDAHDIGAGKLLTVREPGDTEPYTIDAFGRVRGENTHALGGTTLEQAGNRALVASPGRAANGVTGVMFHGQDARPTLPVLELRRFAADSTDQAPIAVFGTDTMTLGRVLNPDATAQAPNPPAYALIERAANRIIDTGEWSIFAAPVDRKRGAAYRELSFGAAGLASSSPMVLSNFSDPTRTAQRVRNYPGTDGKWAGRLAEWTQSKSGAADVAVAYVDAAGRMLANVPDMGGTGERPSAPRDVRQPFIHQTTQRWVLPGQFGLYQGPIIPPGDKEFTHTFPVMRVRSGSPTFLHASCRIEMLTFVATGYTGLDRVVMNCYLAVSINGGAFERVDPAGWEQESVGMTTSPVAYAPGDSTTWVAMFKKEIDPASTFQWRFVVRNSDGFGPIRMRRADLRVDEVQAAMYAQPDPQPLGYNLTDVQKNSGIW